MAHSLPSPLVTTAPADRQTDRQTRALRRRCSCQKDRLMSHSPEGLDHSWASSSFTLCPVTLTICGLGTSRIGPI